MLPETDRGFFVTGIGTGVGKTLTCAALLSRGGFGYFKPVQAGDLENSDSLKIAGWIPGAEIHPETYRLSAAESPHAAARRENLVIDISSINLPATGKWIVEGAGGVFAPLNESETMLDLIRALGLPVIVTVSFYLGSINHTLLTVNALAAEIIPVAGLVFCGEVNEESARFILANSGLPLLFRIPQLKTPDQPSPAELLI